MSGLLRTRTQAAAERGLSSQPKITRNNRVVRSRILLAPPFELARIDPVPKYLVHGRLADGASARQVFALRNCCEFPDGMLPGRAEFIESADQRRQRRVRYDSALAIRAIGVQIADWGVRWPDSCDAFSIIPFRVSSLRLSMKFFAISTLMPWMNFSDERESSLITVASLTK